MNIKQIFKLTLVLFYIFLVSCGYQPMLNETNKKFSITNFTISGDKRLAQILANHIGTSETREVNLSINIFAKKDRAVSNRNEAGKITEYSLNLEFKLEGRDQISNKVIYSKTLTAQSNYKASKEYFDTLNKEKNIVDNLTKTLANQLITELSLIYN